MTSEPEELTADLERRLAVARALATEHGAPLGFHDEQDQLDWDRKGQALLRELDVLSSVVTDEMIERGARVLEEKRDHHSPCLACRDDAVLVLRAALEVTDA